MSKLNDDFRYDSLDRNNDYGLQERNSVLPDEPFGPDEERIFIDDDPFDIDEVFATMDHRDTMRIIPELAFEKHFSTSPTVSMIDYVDRSQRHKKHDAGSQRFRNQRGTVLEHEKNDSVFPFKEENLKQTTTVEADHETRTETGNWSNINFDNFITSSATSDDERVKTQESIQENVQGSFQEEHDQIKTIVSDFSEEPFTEENTKQTENTSEKNNEIYETELQVGKHFHGEKTLNDSLLSIKNDTESRVELKSEEENLREEKELDILRRSGSNEEKNNNVSESFNDDLAPQEKENIAEKEESTKDVLVLKLTSKSYENLPTLPTSGKKDPAIQPTIGPVVVFSKGKKIKNHFKKWF